MQRMRRTAETTRPEPATGADAAPAGRFCLSVRLDFLALAKGELDPPAERTALEHLAACAACRNGFNATYDVNRLLERWGEEQRAARQGAPGRAGDDALEPELLDRIRDRIEAALDRS